MIPLSYNVRSLFVRRTTTIATALGVGLVVFVLAAALMLSTGIQKTLVSAGRDDNAMVLRKGSDTELASGIETQRVSLLQAAPGVKKDESGTPLSIGEAVIVIALDKIGAAEGQVSNVQVRGVPGDKVLKVRPEVRVVSGRPPTPGTDEVMIGRGIAGRFKGVDLNQQFELKKNRAVKVVGIFEAGGSSFESEIWADIDTVRTSFGREGLVSSVTARLESASKFEGFKAFVESDKQLGLESFREDDYYRRQSEGTSIFVTAIGAVIAFFSSFGAMIGAMITMYAAVSQRKREIGTLRALGFSQAAILFSFLVESAVLALLGGALGLVCASFLSFAKISMMNFATWQEITFSFNPDPGTFIISLIAGTAMGIIGGFFPAVRASRVSPIEAMRA